MKKLIVSILVLVSVICVGNILADDTSDKVQSGIGMLGGILNKVSKNKDNNQQAIQGVKVEKQADDQKSAGNANAQSQPSFSKDDIANLSSKIKTNIGSDDLMGIMNSPFHLIAIQAPDLKFGQLFCLFGEGQLSFEQKKKIFGDSIVDSQGKWQTKLVSFNKTNEDTLAVEVDLMMRNDPTESPKPRRRIFYFRYISPGDTIYLIQIKAFGTKQGDMLINNDGASNYVAEYAFVTFHEGVLLFLSSGNYQFNGN